MGYLHVNINFCAIMQFYYVVRIVIESPGTNKIVSNCLFICILSYFRRRFWLPVPLRIFFAQAVLFVIVNTSTCLSLQPWKWPTAAAVFYS